MTPQSWTKPLNPSAPDFTPRNAPPPSAAALQPFPPSCSSYIQLWPPPPPPPVYLFPFYFTSQQPFHTHYAPPQMEVATHYGQTGRACTRLTGWRGKDDKNITSTFSTKDSTRFIKEGRNKHQVVPLKPDVDNTTIMIKNIPYDHPRKELITLLDDFCLVENYKAKNEGTSEEVVTYYAYDFIYLPIDFRSKRGRGFAFVNFTNARAVWKFFDTFHQKKWYFVHGEEWSKKIEIVSAKLQGKEALVNHFRGSVFECERDEFLPALFSPPRDGSGQPVELTVVGNRRAPPLKAAARYNHRRAAHTAI